MTKVENVEALDMALGLIQAAKGADGPDGGFVTDHLDAAENWIDQVRAALAASPPKVESETLQSLAAEFQRWLDKGPAEQPHYSNGMRPFSTGDLKAFVAALTPAPVESGLVERLDIAVSGLEQCCVTRFHANGVAFNTADIRALLALATSEVVAMIDDIIPTEESLRRAAEFIYPDLRPAHEGHDLLVQTVAKSERTGA